MLQCHYLLFDLHLRGCEVSAEAFGISFRMAEQFLEWTPHEPLICPSVIEKKKVILLSPQLQRGLKACVAASYTNNGQARVELRAQKAAKKRFPLAF